MCALEKHMEDLVMHFKRHILMSNPIFFLFLSVWKLKANNLLQNHSVININILYVLLSECNLILCIVCLNNSVNIVMQYSSFNF